MFYRVDSKEPQVIPFKVLAKRHNWLSAANSNLNLGKSLPGSNRRRRLLGLDGRLHFSTFAINHSARYNKRVARFYSICQLDFYCLCYCSSSYLAKDLVILWLEFIYFQAVTGPAYKSVTVGRDNDDVKCVWKEWEDKKRVKIEQFAQKLHYSSEGTINIILDIN